LERFGLNVGFPLSQTCCEHPMSNKGKSQFQQAAEHPSLRGATDRLNDRQIEGANGMARIIEFHISAGFKPKTTWMPLEKRGALIIFPPNLKRSASDVSTLSREMTQQLSAESMELAVIIWPLQELTGL
jgi:hypothetical protein